MLNYSEILIIVISCTTFS